jgi:hypothetical protein
MTVGNVRVRYRLAPRNMADAYRFAGVQACRIIWPDSLMPDDNVQAFMQTRIRCAPESHPEGLASCPDIDEYYLRPPGAAVTAPDGGRPVWENLVDAIGFQAIVLAESKRALCCHPSDLERVTQAVRIAGAEHVFTVRSSVAVAAGQILVVDEQALEAATREAAQRPFIPAAMERPFRLAPPEYRPGWTPYL